MCWLFYSSCFAGWILSTVVTITLLSLGFSRDTVADVEGCVRVVLCSLSGVFPCPAHGSGHYFGLPGHPGPSDMTVLPSSSSLSCLQGCWMLSWAVLVSPSLPCFPVPMGHMMAVKSARLPWGIPSCCQPLEMPVLYTLNDLDFRS